MLRAAWGHSKVALLWPGSQPLAGGPQGGWWDAQPMSPSMLGAEQQGSCSCNRQIGCSCLGLFPGAGWHFDCLFITNRVCIGEGCKWVGGLIGNGDALVACQIPREKHDCSAPRRAERGEGRQRAGLCHPTARLPSVPLAWPRPQASPASWWMQYLGGGEATSCQRCCWSRGGVQREAGEGISACRQFMSLSATRRASFLVLFA